MTWETIGSLLWALVATCLVLALAYWFTRRVAGRLALGQGLRGRSRMRVVDQTPLGRDQRLVLARVGETFYLLGVSQGGITCLRVLSQEEAAPWQEQEQPPAAPEAAMSFREALRKVMEQRKR